MIEEWKDIIGYEGRYQISNLGNARSLINNKFLYQRNRNGYLACKIDSIHRLVAKTFIEKPVGKDFVNHINGNKHDNRVCNLEWVTCSENIQHAWRIGLCNDNTRKKMSDKAKLRTGKKNSCWRGYVNIYKDDKFIIQKETLKDAQQWIRENTKYGRADKGNISLVCNKKLKQIYGYYFEYSTEVIL